MRLETKALLKVMKLIEASSSTQISVHISNVAGLPRMSFEFDNASGDTIVVELAEVNSGGFDKITRSERF
jgi:hypothetical protein